MKTSNKRNSFGVNLDEYTQSIPTLQVKEPTNLYVVTSEIFLHNPYIENIIYTLPFCNNLPLVTNFKNSCTHTLLNEYFTKVLFCLKIFIPNAFWRKTWFKHYEYHSASENGSLWPFMSKLHKASWLGNETWETNTCFVSYHWCNGQRHL